MIRFHYQTKSKVLITIFNKKCSFQQKFRGFPLFFRDIFFLGINSNHKNSAELAELIGEFREGLELGTQWDSTMSSILGMAINSYEINDIYDVAPENSEFQQAVRRTVPTGHTFKGIRFRVIFMVFMIAMFHLYMAIVDVFLEIIVK